MHAWSRQREKFLREESTIFSLQTIIIHKEIIFWCTKYSRGKKGEKEGSGKNITFSHTLSSWKLSELFSFLFLMLCSCYMLHVFHSEYRFLPNFQISEIREAGMRKHYFIFFIESSQEILDGRFSEGKLIKFFCGSKNIFDQGNHAK